MTAWQHVMVQKGRNKKRLTSQKLQNISSLRTIICKIIFIFYKQELLTKFYDSQKSASAY